MIRVRFELTTVRLEGGCSIQLSYRTIATIFIISYETCKCQTKFMQKRKTFPGGHKICLLFKFQNEKMNDIEHCIHHFFVSSEYCGALVIHQKARHEEQICSSVACPQSDVRCERLEQLRERGQRQHFRDEKRRRRTRITSATRFMQGVFLL